MHLARHSITSKAPTQILDARFDADANIFTAVTSSGFAVYQTQPLRLLRKRELSGGTLAAVYPLHTSSLLFLLGGGVSPLYPPNKVILWDDALGRDVVELEFRERVRGIACRRGWLVVVLRRRAVVFKVLKGERDGVVRVGEYTTGDNTRGLVAIATSPNATLLALAGRQMGHVQLIHLPPCPPPAPKSPPSPTASRYNVPPRHSGPTKQKASIIAAHETSLTAICTLPSGRLLATASTRGTLVRVWDTNSGKLVKEFRRGTDKAEIYGVAFRQDERELCVWSDKGTVHVFSLTVGAGATSNRVSTLSPLTPFISLPKYFVSEWSYAQYRIPARVSHISLSSASHSTNMVEDERCTVAWIRAPIDSAPTGDTSKEGIKQEFQIIVITFSGGWYRLGLPSSSSSVHSQSQPQSSSKKGTGSRPASVLGGSPLPSGLRSPSPFLRPRSSSGTSVSGRRLDKGKGRDVDREHERDKDRDKDAKEGHLCTLLEFRRYGRWDGWG